MGTIVDASSIKVGGMPNRPLNLILAANVAFLMRQDGSVCPTARSLAQKAGVSPSTVLHMLKTDSRPYQSSRKSGGYPTLDKIERVAHALGCQAWELLHPDLKQSMRERAMYRLIEADYLKIQKSGRPVKLADNT